MIEEVEIENFRGFVETKLKGLRRLNIVVGDNGSGKTALLEALFTASASSPEVVLKLRNWRGMPGGAAGVTQKQIYEAVWGDLFNEFNLQKIISISLRGSDRHTRSVRIYSSPQPTVLPLTDEPLGTYMQSPSVAFEWKHPFGEMITVTPEVRKGELIIPPVKDTSMPASFLAARIPFNAIENAMHFSNLSKFNDHVKFTEAMKNQFDDIETITLEVEFGAAMLFVKFFWSDRKLPILVLSDGMNKMAAVLLQIATQENGVVFIDEIDTGIYFKRHEKFWDQIHYFCTTYKSQVFATTHSLEFLRAALPTMRENQDDFSLIRVYRDNGVSKATVVSGKEVLPLIESGLELRV